MSSNNTVQDTLTDINFSGGFPTHEDFAPSIVFLAAYLLLVPIVLWRMLSPLSRCRVLIRPTIFISVRIAFCILRILLIKKGLSEGLLIAELILVLCGTILLIEPLVTMLTLHVKEHLPAREGKKRSLMTRVLALLRSLLIIAIILGIVAGSSISGAIGDPSKLASIQTERTASYALSLAAVGLTIIMALLAQARSPSLEPRKTAYVVACGCLLLVVTVYRLVAAHSNEASTAWVRSKSAFWILDITVEWVVTCAYLAISIPEWFPANGSSEDVHRDQHQRPYEMNRQQGNDKYDEV